MEGCWLCRASAGCLRHWPSGLHAQIFTSMLAGKTYSEAARRPSGVLQGAASEEHPGTAFSEAQKACRSCRPLFGARPEESLSGCSLRQMNMRQKDGQSSCRLQLSGMGTLQIVMATLLCSSTALLAAGQRHGNAFKILDFSTLEHDTQAASGQTTGPW